MARGQVRRERGLEPAQPPVRGWWKASLQAWSACRPDGLGRAAGPDRPAGSRASRRVPPYVGVGQQRVAGLGEVDPDLVGPAGVERHLEQRGRGRRTAPGPATR